MKNKEPKTETPDFGVCHLFNVFDVNATLPYEIAPSAVLRKATLNERMYVSRNMRQSKCNFHEMEWTFNPQGISQRFNQNPEEWRYYVIEFPFDELFGPKTKLHFTLSLASWVSEPRFKWAEFSPKDPSPPFPVPDGSLLMGIWAEHEFEFLKRLGRIPVVTLEDLQDLAIAFNQLAELSSEFVFITDAIRLYANSFDVHVESNLRVLALFAVIELLVTHKPKRSDTGDGLTRQVKTKLQLLANRFRNALCPKDFFGVESDDFAWEMIYNYRSLIAHGGKVNFNQPFKKTSTDNGARQLKNEKEVRYFLDEFTRRLLRHALKEPLLIADLKEC